jgi:hypothetical protein
MSYDFDYYSGRHLKYPARPTKPTLGRDPSSVEARAFADALGEYELEFKKYEEDKRWYQSQLSTLMKEFEDKLKKDNDLSDGEFQVIWPEAYDRGHSSGLEEVCSHFNSLLYFAERYILAWNEKGSK